jgi:hypothetical protein
MWIAGRQQTGAVKSPETEIVRSQLSLHGTCAGCMVTLFADKRSHRAPGTNSL